MTATSMMVALAVIVTMVTALAILSHGLANQTQTLLEALRSQSFQRVRASNGLLQHLVNGYISDINHTLRDLTRNRTVTEGISKGQWKALDRTIETACKSAGMDFLVTLDSRGRVQSSWPHQIDTTYPETQFKELALFKRFEKVIANENLVDVPVFSSFERWSREVHEGYDIGIEVDAALVILFASVVPNDYFDEPIGYIFGGITSRRLSPPFDSFLQLTGHAAVLANGQNPQTWSGLSGTPEELRKSLQAFWKDSVPNILPSTSEQIFRHAGNDYNVVATQLTELSNPTTMVSAEASSVFLLTGEGSEILFETSAAINRETAATRRHLMQTGTLVVLAIFLPTVVVVSMVGRKIAKPIEIAAAISDKIASGNLDHLMDESHSGETGTLSRSMNKMIETLKNLRDTNRRQLKALEDSKAKNELILAAIQEGVILSDACTHKIIEANPAAVSMISAEHDDIVGTTSHHYYSEHEEEPLIGGHSDKSSSVSYTDHKLLTQDGNQLPILRTVVPITIEARECLLESFIDRLFTEKSATDKARVNQPCNDRGC